MGSRGSTCFVVLSLAVNIIAPFIDVEKQHGIDTNWSFFRS